MRTSRTRPSGPLVGLLLAAALAGCSGTGTGPATPVPVAAETVPHGGGQTPEATATPTGTPAPVPTAGDVVDLSERDTVPEGLVLYRVGGREFLVLDPNEPLPQVVMDDINGRVAAMRMFDDPVATLVSLEAETGKRFVLVDHCPLCTLGPYEELREIWTVYVSTGALTTGLSSWDEGLGFADDFVSSQPAPEQWVIVQKG